MSLFLVGIVVIFDHEIDISIHIVDQFIAIIEVESNKSQSKMIGNLLSLNTYYIQLLLRIIHLNKQFEGILERDCYF